MSIDTNACYPTLPGKESKAKCYSISSKIFLSKLKSRTWHREQLEHQNRNPGWCFPAPCSLSGRSGQAAGQWLRAVPLLPASRDGAAWGRRKCHPARTQRPRWYLTAGVVKSCTRKNIFSCSWAVPRRLQSWSDTSLVHLPQSAV